MNPKSKDKILTTAKNRLSRVCLQIEKNKKKTQQNLFQSKKNFKTLPAADQLVERQLMHYYEKRIDELSQLQGSPYFVRCDVLFADKKTPTSLYFGKFGFSDEAIYSWVTAASAIRFENPGKTSYRRPDGKIQQLDLLRKDQFMIVAGKIKFFSTETIGQPRQLVYQEYFSNLKTEFALAEIVARMEKVQDQVIRAHHQGPFLISGPAGSGKTTLALHRVAYLAQSPDLADQYPSQSIIVFVQDNGTKEYFSHLLPELGIDDVLITTFSQWAFSLLKIDGRYQDNYELDENEKDHYEFQKISALKKTPTSHYQKNNIFAILERAYHPYFNPQQKKLFAQQKKEKTFDRIDLTLLLKSYQRTNGGLKTEKDAYTRMKSGFLKKRKIQTLLEYSLAVVDEFQNYLPDQLVLIKSCLQAPNHSLLYVGDLAQQVQLGTIQKWEDIQEIIQKERKVVLQKVYRNTKNILTFIKSLGYPINVPAKLKSGPTVREYIAVSKEQEIGYIKTILQKSTFASAAILAKDQRYLALFKEAFSQEKKVHIFSINETQGVEFDIVFLVGITTQTFSARYFNKSTPLLAQEKRRINRDLLYVALTRAISQLHVLGKTKLSQCNF